MKRDHKTRHHCLRSGAARALPAALRADAGESFSAVPRRRRWLLFMPFALVVALAAGWSVVWFYAAARAEPELVAWREAERRAGRTQDCASQSIGGYPFRIEVRCGGAGLELKG